MRFLAVIQIDESNSMSFADAKPDADNTIVIGNYRIKAQMDTSQEARLEIENKTTGEYLLYGPANGAVKAKERKFSHSTLLINKTSGCQETIDRCLSRRYTPKRSDVSWILYTYCFGCF